MTDSIFDSHKVDPKQSENQPPAEKTQEMFNSLVGEGKKFQDPEALAASKVEADKFIEQLQAENAEMRKQMERVDNADKTLAELRAQVQSLEGKLSNQPSGEPSPNTTGALTAEDVSKLVADTMTAQEAKRTANQNIQEVNDAMVRHFGDMEKAREAFATRAQETGMSVEDLQALAAKSPTAFQRIVIGDQAAPAGKADPTGAGNSQNHTPNAQLATQAKQGTKEWFTQQRKEKGHSWYFQPEVQKQIMQAKLAGTYE